MTYNGYELVTKISACIVVRNEGRLLERCLQSIVSKVDEILVVHDGPCDDDTLEVAKRYTDKVTLRDYRGFAEPHWIFLYQVARNDWILKIDADEYLSTELEERLDSIPNVHSQFNAFEFYWPLWNGKSYFTAKGLYKLALFNRRFITVIALPHEPIRLLSGEKLRLKYQLHHKPTANNYTFAALWSKQLKWIKLNAKFLSQDFQDIEKFNCPADATWPKKLALKRNYPYLTMLYLPFVNITQTLRECGSILNLEVIRFALSRGLYAFLLYFYMTWKLIAAGSMPPSRNSV